jgi:hypothetical protein
MSKYCENMEKARKEPLGEKKLLNIYEAAVYTSRSCTRLRPWLVEIGAHRKYGGRSLYDRATIDRAIDNYRG